MKALHNVKWLSKSYEAQRSGHDAERFEVGRFVMVSRSVSSIFDRASLRGLQFFWPVILLPFAVLAIDTLQSNQMLVVSLLVAWGCYLTKSYGAEGWRMGRESSRASLDLAFNLTQGIGLLLLPLAILGAASLGCKSCVDASCGSFLIRALDLVALAGAMSAVLLFFLFVPATAIAFIGSASGRIVRAQQPIAWGTVRASFGGVSFSVLMALVASTSVLASVQIMYRFVAKLAM